MSSATWSASSSSSASASHSASDLHEQPPKRARLQHGEDDAVAAAVHEAVQATLDSSAAAVSGDKRDWEHGLSSLISDYAAPTLAYHVLCSDAMEPDVSSFDTVYAMLHHLRRRYHKEELSSGASEVERSAAEVEAECAKMLRQNDRTVTAAQEETDETDREYPFDEEIAALHAQRITLEEQEERGEEEEPNNGNSESWSVSTSLPLSASPSSLQPPFVLFQQCNLSWKGMHRDSWYVQRFDSAEQLTDFLQGSASGCDGGGPDSDGEGDGLSLTDLLRRARHLSRQGARARGGSSYLSAAFHRARTVWYVRDRMTGHDSDSEDSSQSLTSSSRSKTSGE